MSTRAKLTMPERFFYNHAGWSYDPVKETRERGRVRCARNYAAVEAIAREGGYSFEWTESDISSAEFSDARPVWQLWDCIMRDASGRVVQSLHGCDFGRKATGPYGDYRRVVEAELADEECGAVLRAAAG